MFQLSRLCKRLDEIWSDNVGEVVLFMWASFLNEPLEYLQINTPLDLSNVVPKRRRSRLRKPSGGKQSTINSQNEMSTSNTNAANQNTSDNNKSCDLAAAIQTELDAEPELTHDSRAIQDIACQDLLLPTILDHDAQQQELDFQNTLFTCQVCFMEKLGCLCLSFTGCDHVYCKDCMKGYFEVQIAEGNVQGLICPSDKCDSQAHPAQVNIQHQ